MYELLHLHYVCVCDNGDNETQHNTNPKAAIFREMCVLSFCTYTHTHTHTPYTHRDREGGREGGRGGDIE